MSSTNKNNKKSIPPRPLIASFTSITTFSSSPTGSKQVHLELTRKNDKLVGLYERRNGNKTIEKKEIKSEQDLKRLLEQKQKQKSVPKLMAKPKSMTKKHHKK